MADREPLPVPEDPLDWTPMRAYQGRRTFEVKDPIVEPLWSGTRALAHVRITPEADSPAEIALIDETGLELSAELPEVTAALAGGVLALDAVIDGVITHQVMLDGVGAAAIPEIQNRPTEMFVRSNLDFDVKARGVSEEQAQGGVSGFVAVDLLRLDGTQLLDIPLLERKRLLESIIAISQLLRVSLPVRPPADPWIATWKSSGLKGGMLKAANSRYHPNDDTIEWRVVERLNRRR